MVYACINRVLTCPSQIEEVSLPGIRRTLLRLERAINKNQDQRSKYPNDPTKFIDSEADLDVAIKALMPLSQAPALAYPEIVKTGTITMLVGLLSHENMDIVIDVVEVIHELTDEDVGGEADEDEGDEVDEEMGQSKKDLGMKLLIDALVRQFRFCLLPTVDLPFQLKESILELLVQNFGRFNEEDESDRQGLFHVLGPRSFQCYLCCRALILTPSHLREPLGCQPGASRTNS